MSEITEVETRDLIVSMSLAKYEQYETTKPYAKTKAIQVDTLEALAHHPHHWGPDFQVVVYGNRKLKDGTLRNRESFALRFDDDQKRAVPAPLLCALREAVEKWRASL